MMGSDTVVSMLVFLAVFLAISAVGFCVFLRFQSDRRRALQRLRDLGSGETRGPEISGVGDLARSTLPRLGTLLVAKEEHRVANLRDRLVQAGFYRRNALRAFMGAKLMLMMVLPILFGLVPYLLGWLGLQRGLLFSVVGSALGMLAPNLWLATAVRRRQSALRNALPDALDMLVLCVEGGLSLTAATQRVTAELQVVHPLLGVEMNLFQREIQLGLSAGEAFRKLGERCGLDEVRELASVILQSERYGASVVKALRTHADSWRLERQQRAEEMAQKAAVKILFPTLLFIFPAIFIVLLGPAAFQIAGLFSK